MKLTLSKNLQNALKKGFDLSDPIEKALVKSALLIQNTAKKLAPYDSWNLRRSISSDLGEVNQWLVAIGSDVKYAVRREFENKLNPDRKFYMKRSAWDNENKVIANILEAMKRTLW